MIATVLSYTTVLSFGFLLQLKSPMQIMMVVDAEQQTEMEAMIRELEAENRFNTKYPTGLSACFSTTAAILLFPPFRNSLFLSLAKMHVHAVF